MAFFHHFPYARSTGCPNHSEQLPRHLDKRPGCFYDFALFYFVRGQSLQLSESCCTPFKASLMGDQSRKTLIGDALLQVCKSSIFRFFRTLSPDLVWLDPPFRIKHCYLFSGLSLQALPAGCPSYIGLCRPYNKLFWSHIMSQLHL